MSGAVSLIEQVLITIQDRLKKAVERAGTVLTYGLLARFPHDNEIFTVKRLEFENYKIYFNAETRPGDTIFHADKLWISARRGGVEKRFR